MRKHFTSEDCNLSVTGSVAPITGSVTPSVAPTESPSEPDSPPTLSSMLEDNAGGLSALRILMLTWGFGVFAIWVFVTVLAAIHGVYTGVSIPESVITVLLGLTAGKVIQRPFEK